MLGPKLTQAMHIYVLRLVQGKYYVGQTADVIKRYQEHSGGQGAAWTKRYKPIRLLRTLPCTSPFDEDTVTKQYMAKYGIDNVRGGVHVQVELSTAVRGVLQKEMRGAQGACFQCGQHGHFIRTCTDHASKSKKSTSKGSDAIAAVTPAKITARRCAYCIVHKLSSGPLFSTWENRCASCGTQLLGFGKTSHKLAPI